MKEEITKEQIKKVSVSMCQKINLGNYETRDYFGALEFEVLPTQDAIEVMQFGRDLIAEEIGEYYKKIKKGLLEPPSKEDFTDEQKVIVDLIDKAEDKEQLKSLENKVKEADDKAVTNYYNSRKLK